MHHDAQELSDTRKLVGKVSVEQQNPPQEFTYHSVRDVIQDLVHRKRWEVENSWSGLKDITVTPGTAVVDGNAALMQKLD